jgi:hypothetical protein
MFIGMARGEPWTDELNPPAVDVLALNIGTISNEAYTGASLNSSNTKTKLNQKPFLGGIVEYKVIALSTNTFEVRKVSDNSLVGATPQTARTEPYDNLIQGIDLTVSNLTMTPGHFYTFKVDGPMGFKRIENKYLVVPDPEGTIDYRGTRWGVVSAQDAYKKGARYVYVQGFFRYDELPLVDYRQVGLFTGLTRANGVGNDIYALLPAQVGDCGALEVLDNRTQVTRNPDQKESYSFVIEL